MVKILLAGDGGQGIQLLSDVICRAAIEHGLYAASIPNYGLEQRGGVSVSFIQIQNTPIVYPKFKTGDLVVILSERSVLRTWRYVGEDTTVIYNASFIPKSLINLPKR